MYLKKKPDNVTTIVLMLTIIKNKGKIKKPPNLITFFGLDIFLQSFWCAPLWVQLAMHLVLHLGFSVFPEALSDSSAFVPLSFRWKLPATLNLLTAGTIHNADQGHIIFCT